MKIMSKEEFLNKYTGDEFRYMLLGRMESDCLYYINVEKPMNCPHEYDHLWAREGVEAHITYMRYLWESLPEKPEWLTMEQIDEYERLMTA